MLAGKPPAIVLRDETAIGNAKKRIMRLVHRRRTEMHVIGGDQGQALGVSKLDQLVFDGGLASKTMTLHLDIEPVTKGGA